MITPEPRNILGETESDEQVRLLKDAKMCHSCYSIDILYGNGYRRCNACGTMLNTEHVVWG